MLNQVQHDDCGESNVTLNLFQGLMNTDASVFNYGLWIRSNPSVMGGRGVENSTGIPPCLPAGRQKSYQADED
jgi:hypothetical protein